MDGSLSILVVEDDRGIVALMQGIFEDEGFHVRMAMSGEQGLELFAAEVPDVIVLDLMLPGINGMVFLDRIRSDGYTTPVVIASAQRDASLLARQAGAAFVAKPFDVEHLLEAVRAASSKR